MLLPSNNDQNNVKLELINEKSDADNEDFDKHYYMTYGYSNNRLKNQLKITKTDQTNSIIDEINYSVGWYSFNKKREEIFYPWQTNLGQTSWEKIRIQAFAQYWRTCISHKINPTTIHLAIWISNKLFNSRKKFLMTKEWFAGIVAISFRIALKFEERPDSLWYIGKIWDVFPIFCDWSIDKSDQFLLKLELECIKILDEIIDAPLSIQFFDQYIQIGLWPTELVKDYISLGHFILALSTFSSSHKGSLINIPPSELGAAAAILAVKIVNGDSRLTSYEYFPQRLADYTNFTIKQLQPIIRNLSSLLRRKPLEAQVLSHIYPEWGAHDWQ